MPRSIFAFWVLHLGCSGEKGLTVHNSPPAATITNPIEGKSYPAGELIEFKGIVNDSYTSYDELVVTWSTDKEGLLTDEALADVDGLTVFSKADLTPNETHTVTLRVVDSGGKSASDSVVIRVDDVIEEEVTQEPTVTILSPHPSGSDSPWEEGILFPFEARIGDGQDDPELISVTISTVDPDGEELELLCTTLPYILSEDDTDGYAYCEVAMEPGVHSLLFTATDTEGYVGTATGQLRVQSSDAVDNDGDGFTEMEGDCDDTDEDVHPGAIEFVNGVDDDCNGLIDDGTDAYDDDGDGYSENTGDCDDSDASIHPYAVEVCDGIDNDCSGITDGEEAVDGTTYYQDIDGDSFGNAAASITACSPTSGYVTNNDDCDDTDADAHPGGTEVCDGIDNDCNGFIDDEGAVGCTYWFQDLDDDGYGSTISSCSCAATGDFTSPLDTDCYDASAMVNPTHTSFHASNRGDGSYDYNCDDSEERQWTTTSDSCGFFEDFGCSATNGWSGSLPSCGTTSTWRETCSYSSSGWPWEWGCYWDTEVARTQTCR